MATASSNTERTIYLTLDADEAAMLARLLEDVADQGKLWTPRTQMFARATAESLRREIDT